MENLFKQSSETDRHFPFNEAAWKDMESRLEQSEKDVIIIEGQGSLAHPGSTATLPLIRGSQPTHLILCHKAAHSHLRYPVSHVPIPPLGEFIKLNEAVATVCGSLNEATCIGVALNTVGLDKETALRKIQEVEQMTELPTTDVVLLGADRLVEAVLNA